MSEIFPAGDGQYSQNLGLALWGADEVVIENFLLIDAAFGSVGGSVNVNGVAVPAPANFINSATVTFSVVGSNISLTASGSAGTFPVTFPAVAHEWLNSYSSVTGLFTATQPSAADLSNGTDGTGAVVLASAISEFGDGTVTSVSFTGGLISVATPTTTPSLSVAGTSGGIPYFSSASTWASSGVLPAGDFVLGGGAGSAPTASFSVVPVANGGTGTGSTLTGLIRGSASAFTAAEISGDATTSGSNALTLATVNSNVGSFTYASITVNAKGLVTAASSGSAPTGTVTSFSAGNLSPLFTTSVATSTTTPALTFALTNAAGGTVFGNNTGSSGAPAYTGTPILGVNASVAGTLGLANGGALGTTITIQNLGNTTAYNFNLPTTAGTAGQVLTSQAGASTSMTWTTPTIGTVTSVSFTGGLISVANPTTTPAFTVAGTSGGIPYFSSTSTWASSALLPAGDFVLGGGAGAAPTATFSIVPIANGGTGAATVTAGTVFGNPSGSTAAPSFTSAPVLGLNATTAGTLGLATSVASGATITLTNPGALTAYNFELPLTVGAAGSVLTSQAGSAMTWTTQAALGVAWSSLTNASGNLSLSNGTNTTTFNQTSGVAWLWANTTTGTSGTTNASPLLELAAQYYTGSATGTDTWTLGSSLAAGTNGASTFTFTQAGSSGKAVVLVPSLTSTNDCLINGMTVGLGLGQISSNIAFGLNTLATNTTGDYNTAIGYQALYKNTTGGYNTAIGYQALYTNTTGLQNTAIGLQALFNNTGTDNMAIGFQALYTNTTGTDNIALGLQALYKNTTGTDNIAIGYQAGYTATAGNANVSGSNNTWVGYNAGPNTSTQLSNATALGNGALNSASNQISLGNSSVTALLIAGTAGITQSAEAVGTLATTCGIVTTFTAVSDERLKIFTEYEGGLTEILAINPIRYRWNEKGQELSGQKGDRDYIGFSANNVQKSIPESIQSYKGEERYLSFDDRPVIAALVNAVKTLAARVEALEKRV